MPRNRVGLVTMFCRVLACRRGREGGLFLRRRRRMCCWHGLVSWGSFSLFFFPYPFVVPTWVQLVLFDKTAAEKNSTKKKKKKSKNLQNTQPTKNHNPNLSPPRQIQRPKHQKRDTNERDIRQNANRLIQPGRRRKQGIAQANPGRIRQPHLLNGATLYEVIDRDVYVRHDERPDGDPDDAAVGLVVFGDQAEEEERDGDAHGEEREEVGGFGRPEPFEAFGDLVRWDVVDVPPESEVEGVEEEAVGYYC